MTPRRSAPCAQVLVTGDELLRGFVQDANSGFLAAELRRIGVTLQRIEVVGDTLDEIAAGLARAGDAGADLVIVSGGLGPTHDDRTTEAVAAGIGQPLELRQDALDVVESRVRAHGRMRTPEEAAIFTPGNHKQATLPVGATMLDPLGTAPGYVVAGSGVVHVVLPGPPSELRHAWLGALSTEPVRALVERVPPRHERLVRVWGVPESHASQVLSTIGHEDSAACRVTICARDGELEISGRGAEPAQVDALVQELARQFGAATFALDDERPVAALVGERLAARGWRLAVAESCTGGLVGGAITAIPGSSAWFQGGIVSYADDVKRGALGVDARLLGAHGAVSREIAEAMAQGACAALGCEVGLAVTGIAGPGGGSHDKPVGTVHIAALAPGGVLHRRMRIPGDRETVRRRSVRAALHLLRELLESDS